MTPEQLEMLLAAAQKTLFSRHDLLDYLTFLAPIITAALGWMAAYIQFRSSFRKGLEKEHYYASKQNVLEILKLDDDFLRYLYEIYKTVQSLFSYMRPLPMNFLSDFITNYQSKMAAIHLMRRIEFPESTFEDQPTIDLLKKLEAHISKMNQRVMDYLQTKHATETKAASQVTEEEASNYSLESTRLIDSITNQISLQDNIMVKILSNEAKRLGIRTIMPKILRKI